MWAAPPGRPGAVTFEVRHVTYASPVSRSIPLWLDQLCFFARQLGLGQGSHDRAE